VITYVTGNLLEAHAEALINTVNEIGVMGKGVALQFREAFPGASRAYMQAAKRGDVRVGRVMATSSGGVDGPRWIIHFPTKRHWRHPSKLAWVREGLTDLVRAINELRISSIAIPPLGCGNGGLDWADVRLLLEEALGNLPGVEVVVFEPTARYAPAPKRRGVEELTPARALVAEMIRRYSVLGLGCTLLEVQKLAWFLHRAFEALGTHDPLRVRFSANSYGPYSDQLRHLLDALDGSYLHCERRLSEAGPLDYISFADERRQTVTAYLEGQAREYLPGLDAATRYIDGFESPLGMELLATVDWLVAHQGWDADEAVIRRALDEWPGGHSAGQRKQRLFDDRMLGLALERVREGIHLLQPQMRLC